MEPQVTTSSRPNSTIWVGYLPKWTKESHLWGWMSERSYNQVRSVKLMRDNITGQPEGYGLVDFSLHAVAEMVLYCEHGQNIPGTDHPFWLNWAHVEGCLEAGHEYFVYVEGLAPEVTDEMLREEFNGVLKEKLPDKHFEVRGAKVVCDPSTGASELYGFVSLDEEEEKKTAMDLMDGVFICGSIIHVLDDAPQHVKDKSLSKKITLQQQLVIPRNVPPANHTIWIGHLPYWANEIYLRRWFNSFSYDKVASVEVVQDEITKETEGYVGFAFRAIAEMVLYQHHGENIPGTDLCFWMNWLLVAGQEKGLLDTGPWPSIRVDGLAHDVTDEKLKETFSKYGSVKGVKVIFDPSTGQSKGYGFISFKDKTEKTSAMKEKNGKWHISDLLSLYSEMA